MQDSNTTTRDVPGVRPYIGIFGRRNAGKSTLFNRILGRSLSVVSDVKGTTTDPVEKTMELAGAGSVTFIDTPGYDDSGDLGAMRVEQSIKSSAKCNVALIVTERDDDPLDRRWAEYLEGRGAAVLRVSRNISREEVLDKVTALLKPLPEGSETILGGLVSPGDTVVLVMPQDKAAPKGRLIMPQMQTIRELLDRGCIPVCLSPENLRLGLSALSAPPALIVTDSQAFAPVRQVLSEVLGEGGEYESADKDVVSDVFGGVPLTSFSILFSRYKGDLGVFRKGAAAIPSLRPDARILIAEACAHRPLSEDIGRVKLPALLRKRLGGQVSIDVVAGNDWPSDLSGYDLVIHCGACMFNRRHVLNRISDALKAGVPMTNYGLAIAWLTRK